MIRRLRKTNGFAIEHIRLNEAVTKAKLGCFIVSFKNSSVDGTQPNISDSRLIYTAIYRKTRLDRPPAALRAHAQDVIRKLGYPQPRVDSADGVVLKYDLTSPPSFSATRQRCF